MHSDRDWTYFEPYFPRRLIDGSWSGFLLSKTLMRRREKGAWVYRKMNPDEAAHDDERKLDFQTW